MIAGSALGMLAGGWLADAISRRARDPVLWQKALAAGCYGLAAVFLLAGARLEDPLALSGCWCASFMAMHVTLPNWWVVASRQAQGHLGAILGLLNGVGIVGAMASQWFVGAFTDWRAGMGLSPRDQWDPMFTLYACVLVAAGAAWWSYLYKPIESDDAPTGPGTVPAPPG